MSDDRFDRDLADVLRTIAGEEAPMSLRFRLSDLTERAPMGRRMWFATPMRLSMVAVASVAVLALAIIFLPRETVGPTPTASPSIEPTPSVEPTPGPSVEPASAPTVEPTPAVTTGPTPTPGALGEWTGLVWSDPVTPSFAVHLNDLLPWGDGYVAVGEVEINATRTEAAFLTSSDGLHWTMTYQVYPGLDRFPAHLIRLGDELLAFSPPNPDMMPMAGSTLPLIWQSTDGSRWSLLDSPSWRDSWSGLVLGDMPVSWDPTQYEPVTGLVDVASGPRGIVAVGNSFTAAGDGMIPVILQSADGRTWSRVSLPADPPSAMLNTVVAHGNGFVMVGAVNLGPDPDIALPASWHSTDGLAWTRAMVEADPSHAGALHGEFGPLMAATDGLVTCFNSREMGAGGWRFMDAWVSLDGTTWEPGHAATIDSPIRACGWAAGDGVRIVALGGRPSPNGQPWPGVTSASISSDGAGWEPLTVSSTLTDMLERFWLVPDGVIYAGEQSFWFGTAVVE